jgi:hypothetical protein
MIASFYGPIIVPAGQMNRVLPDTFGMAKKKRHTANEIAAELEEAGALVAAERKQSEIWGKWCRPRTPFVSAVSTSGRDRAKRRL